MSKFLRRDALKVLSSILVVCPTDHVLYMIQQSSLLPVIFGILMKADENKAIKNNNITIRAPSKSELSSYYENLLSLIW